MENRELKPSKPFSNGTENDDEKTCEEMKHYLEWYLQRYGGNGSVHTEACADALALIKSQEEKIFALENRLKECENGYEGTLFLDRCKLHDAEERVKELTEENDKLHASCTELARVQEESERLIEAGFSAVDYAVDKIRGGRIEIVRKMQSEIKERCIKGGIYPAFVESTIDQIAKEMLEGEP